MGWGRHECSQEHHIHKARGRRQGRNDESHHDTLRLWLRKDCDIYMSASSPTAQRRFTASRAQSAGALASSSASFATEDGAERRAMFSASTSLPRLVHAQESFANATEQKFAQLARPRSVKRPREVQRWTPLLAHVSSLKTHLEQKYGSVVAGWRDLDPLDNGRVGFADFCRASRKLGYICDTQSLWKMVDLNQDGFVTLEEVDADLAALLYDFRLAILASGAKSAESVWRRLFSDSCMGRCKLDRFLNAARALGYRGDAEAVYAALNVGGHGAGVSYKEFRLLDKWFQDSHGGYWNYEVLRPSLCSPDLRFAAESVVA